MKVVGIAGYSGAGKTTLVERLIPALKLRGLRVSVVKHAHHDFDIDHPGKDSWRHRQAGVFEIVVASRRRLALLREYERECQPQVHHVLAELYAGVDWVLVEGFKSSDLLKIEVWRADNCKPVLYASDDFIAALVTDDPSRLPVPTGLDTLNLNDADAVAAWLIEHGERFEYDPAFYLDDGP